MLQQTTTICSIFLQEPELVEMHVMTDLDKSMVDGSLTEQGYCGKPMVDGSLTEQGYCGKPMVENQSTNLSSGEASSSESLLTSKKTVFGNARIKVN